MFETTITGNLGRDPDMSYTPAGIAYTKFSVAAQYYDFQKKSNMTVWFNCTAWNKQAENCNEYLRKGSKVLVRGRYLPRMYTNKEGSTALSHDLNVETIEFLSSTKSHNDEYDGDVAGLEPSGTF